MRKKKMGSPCSFLLYEQNCLLLSMTQLPNVPNKAITNNPVQFKTVASNMDWPWRSLLNSELRTSSITIRFRSSRGSPPAMSQLGRATLKAFAFQRRPKTWEIFSKTAGFFFQSPTDLKSCTIDCGIRSNQRPKDATELLVFIWVFRPFFGISMKKKEACRACLQSLKACLLRKILKCCREVIIFPCSRIPLVQC